MSREVLRSRWVAALARCCARAQVVDVDGSPLDGACLLATTPGGYRAMVHTYLRGVLR